MNADLHGIDVKALVQRAVERGMCSAPVMTRDMTNSKIQSLRNKMNGLTASGSVPVDRELHRINPDARIRKAGTKIATIIRCVASFYKIQTEVLTSSTRRDAVAWARHVAFFFIREFCMERVVVIAKEFNGRSETGCDHTTVCYGIKRVKKACDSYRSTAEEIEMLRAKIKEVLG